MTDIKTSVTVLPPKSPTFNKVAQVSAIRSARELFGDYVPHLKREAVTLMVDSVTGRKVKRDQLLIKFLFDSCLRISEALSVRPRDIRMTDQGCLVYVNNSKGGKAGVVAVGSKVAAEILAYAYTNNISMNDRIFTITRVRAFQIVQAAMKAAGIEKPPHVGHCHVLRHAGAIERLRLTRNFQALQHQLLHATAGMTFRYLKTVTHEECMREMAKVDPWQGGNND